MRSFYRQISLVGASMLMLLAPVSAQEQPGIFTDLVREAVENHPRVNAAISGYREAKQARREVRARYLPTIDLDVGGDASFTREFEERFDNIVERSRDPARADVVLRGEQRLYDGGETRARLNSSDATIDAREGDVDTTALEVAVEAASVYLNVLRLRHNLDLAHEFEDRHLAILDQVQTRYDEGVGALRDVARLRARLADAAAIRANIERAIAAAESRYLELFKEMPPATLLTPEPMDSAAVSVDQAIEIAYRHNPILRASAAETDAARFQLRAAESEYLPSVSFSVDATKFEVFDGRSDYDVRGRLAVTYNIFSGGARSSRRNQALHRFKRSEFDEENARQEINRDIATAFRELEVLESQVSVLERAQTANREARDLYVEQFRIARGTLLDLLQAEADYFNATIAYTDGVWDRDVAKYRLLSLTGELLEKFGIQFSFTDAQNLWRRP